VEGAAKPTSAPAATIKTAAATTKKSTIF
jgi:hypothetical protein